LSLKLIVRLNLKQAPRLVVTWITNKDSADTQGQGAVIMIKQNLAVISTIGKMHLENVLATESNMPPELLPTRKTNKQ
jgi:hypothetical protein